MASYKKKIRIALKKDLFVDREYTMTVYRCAENAFAKTLVSAVKFVGITDKRSSKSAVTISVLLAYKEPKASSKDIWRGVAGRTVNKSVDIDLINLTTCKVKRFSTKASVGRYVGSITISYSDDFFTDGRNKLMLTVAGSAGRIRGYRTVTVHKGMGLAAPYSELGEDLGDDGEPMEFAEIEEELPEIERGVCYDLSRLEDDTGIEYEELKDELEERGAICVSNVCCMPPARDKAKECDDVCKLMAMKVLFSE